MPSEIDAEQVKEIILRELPNLVQRDLALRQWVIDLASQRFADKAETESRFNRMLEELKRDREEATRRWEENNRKWEDNRLTFEQMSAESKTKWEENQKVINQILQEIKNLSRRHDQSIGALGARWGLHSEESFRSALKGILEESFPVRVITVTEYDANGEVFGTPDQIELDIIIHNGTQILCEIKSSASVPDVYAFQRKVQFYEKHHQIQAQRKIIISPMVSPPAQAVAQHLGIEVFSHAEDTRFDDTKGTI